MFAGGLIAMGCALAALLPVLVDAEAIRGKFGESLSALSGGPALIKGLVQIGSLTELSIEAAGVEIAPASPESSLRSATAQSVTAILRLPSLLRGEIEFSKFIVESPRIVFRRGSQEPVRSPAGLDGVRAALLLAAKSPSVELRDAVFFFAPGGNKPYERIGLDRVRLNKSAAAPLSNGVMAAHARAAENSLFALTVSRKDLEASFRGQCAAACRSVFGSLRLRAGLSSKSGAAILSSFAPWERSTSLALAGHLNLSKHRAALDDAKIEFSDHSAEGAFALDMTGARPRLEGTVAYDTLDISPVWTNGEEGVAERHPLAALPLTLKGQENAVDFDLRLSAERFRAGAVETGPLALALTKIEDRLNLDIASVEVFGGRLTGRVDVDPGQPAVLSLTASGSPLDSRALASALGLPLGFRGPVTLRAAFSLPMTMRDPATDATEARGTFSVRFPAGGSIEGDMARALGAALDGRDPGWGFRARSFPFEAASVGGTVTPGTIDLDVEGLSGEKRIGGSLKVALPTGEVKGTLLASSDAPTGEAENENVARNAAEKTKLLLSGTADALVLSAAAKPGLSN